MKTKLYYLGTKLLVAIIFIVILVVKATASEAPKLKMISHSDERAIVIVDNSGNSFAEIVIENANGNIIYYREGRIDAKNYSKIFDFKNLQNGDYKIIVSNNFGEQEANFSVLNNKVIVNNHESLKPFFSLNGNTLNLSTLNHASNNLYFSITNRISGEVYTKALGNDFNITTGFNLEKLSTGAYTAKLSDGRNSYTYTFEK